MKKKGFSVLGLSSAHSWPAGTNGNVGIVGAAEGIEIVQMGVTTMVLQVLKGRQGGAFILKIVRGPCIEGLIVGLGGRIGPWFQAHHDADK